MYPVMNGEETKHERFRRIAKLRVSNALKSIRLVGNLSVKGTYEYTDAEVAKIKEALIAETHKTLDRFDQGRKNEFYI
jgi:hypothetical protein